MEIVGPFPEKTPLNPKITGTIKREGYRIEKIVYEAMPSYYVTGCLYVPEGVKGKVPAIVNVIGHNQEAFRNELYQVINYNLVKKGMMVFAIDPPGQGEHVQYYDPVKKFSSVGYTVIEHTYFGNQCFLSGSSAARYFTWEGIRAIDYLVSRPDVDPERIGVTGFSGGGTVTSYISAFDDRVKVSVPCSWATLNRALLDTKAGQDGESIVPAGVARGITFEDFIEVRAPKPTLMTFVSRDEYLALQGARDALDEARKAYRAYGLEENIQLSEDDSKHWMTKKIRYDIYAFFMKHFNLPGDPAEIEAELFSYYPDLQVTPTGQISTSYGGEMVFDVNRRETERLIGKLRESRKNIDSHIGKVKESAREISGFKFTGDEAITAFINGKYQRDGYTVGKYAIPGEGKYAIPFLMFVPDDNIEKNPVIIYLSPDGKAADAAPGGKIEKLVKEGYAVAAVDVLGIGEVKNTAVRGNTTDYTGVAIGRSQVAVQAGDIVRIVKYLKTLGGVDGDNIGAMAINGMCIPLIHAAAFDSDIKKVILSGPLASYRTVAMNRIYKIGLTEIGRGSQHPYESDFAWGVAGALTAYDLPDLLGCIAPRKLAITGIKDHLLESASEDIIKEDTAFPLSVYSFRGAKDNFRIFNNGDNYIDLVNWCFK
jgi:cephalosporin-C deacetylase-like acetyl esterase